METSACTSFSGSLSSAKTRFGTTSGRSSSDTAGTSCSSTKTNTWKKAEKQKQEEEEEEDISFD